MMEIRMTTMVAIAFAQELSQDSIVHKLMRMGQVCVFQSVGMGKGKLMRFVMMEISMIAKDVLQTVLEISLGGIVLEEVRVQLQVVLLSVEMESL